MNELYEKLESWIEKQKYTFAMGEWFRGKSAKAITTDKLSELVPPTIKDSYTPKDIKEQLNLIANTLEANGVSDDLNCIDFDAISNTGVSNSIFSVGEEIIKLELRGFANLPGAVDRELMSNVVYALDSNEQIVFFFSHKHESNCIQYTMIDGKDMDIDVESALLKSRKYQEVQTWWENLLLKWETDIVRIWNLNVRNPHNAVQEYIMSNIPITLITACKLCIIGTKQKISEEEVVIKAKGVKFETSKGRVQYSDFVSLNVATHKSSSITELPKFPKIYGNAGEDAMSIFDIKKYINNDTQLSEYWLEVKSKYTEDEWAVLCAWTIGTLDSKNNGRQALAQIDYDGYSGKSVLSDVLTRVLTLRNVGAIGKGSIGNQFWASKLWNKRLIVSDDNKNIHLLQSEAVHCTLGGGYADVEYKGETSFTHKMSSRILINSNVDLAINSSLLHERSRIIILNPKMPKTLVDKLTAKDKDGNVQLDQHGNPKLMGDPNFADNLVATVDGFLTEAMKYYRLLCPNRSDIILPNSVIEKVYENETTEETVYNGLLKKAFDVTNDRNDTMTQSEFLEQYMHVAKTAKAYNQCSNNQEYGNFKQFIKKVHKIESTGRDRLYRGIRASSYVGPDSNNPNSQFKEVLNRRGFGRD